MSSKKIQKKRNDNNSGNDIQNLIWRGAQMGYLRKPELDEILREKLAFDEDYDDFLGMLDELGIELTGQSPHKQKTDSLSSSPEAILDPVKIYFKDMGKFDLLSKEGEIRLAKQIERGEKIINKPLSKTRLGMAHVLALEDTVKDNAEAIPRIFNLKEVFPEENLDQERKWILRQMRRIKKLDKKLQQIPIRTTTFFARGRIAVEISRIIRNLNIYPSRWDEVIKDLRRRINDINRLEDEKEEVFLALKKASREGQKKELKKRRRILNRHLREHKAAIGLSPQAVRKVLRSIAYGVKTSDQASTL